MYKEGHLGIALLFLSPAAPFAELLGVPSREFLGFALLVALASALPDVDIRLRPLFKHRGKTHTLFAGFAFGSLFALFGSSPARSLYLFSVAFLGVLSHLVGDMLTYTPVMPLWPLSKREVALKLFKSSNKLANYAFLAAGVAAFTVVGCI